MLMILQTSLYILLVTSSLMFRKIYCFTMMYMN